MPVGAVGCRVAAPDVDGAPRPVVRRQPRGDPIIIVLRQTRFLQIIVGALRVEPRRIERAQPRHQSGPRRPVAAMLVAQT